MATVMNNRSPQGQMQVLHDLRKMQQGSPKLAPARNGPKGGKMQKVSSGIRTGDAVSDDSENDDPGGDDSAPEDSEDSGDEADGFALLGAQGSRVNRKRLAGFTSQGQRMARELDDEDAVAGDDNDYEGLNEISDSDGDDETDEKTVLRAAEQDLIAEYERKERPQTAGSMSTGMTGLTLAEDNALARRLSLQREECNEYRELDFSLDPFGGLATNDSLYEEMVNEAVGEYDLSGWRDPEARVACEDSIQSNGNEKKVRFVDTASSRSSSLSSEEDPRDTFPDLFDEAEAPMARSQFLMDMEMAIEEEEEEEYEPDFDTEAQYARTKYLIDASDTESAFSSDDSSDSEEDGDTTDEEAPAEQMACMLAMKAERTAKSGAVPPSSNPVSAPTTSVGSRMSSGVSRPINAGRSSRAKGNGKPMSGTFEHDPTQAHVEPGINGNGVKLICPTKPTKETAAFWERARQVMGSRDGSPNGPVSWTRTTPRAQSAPQRPFTAKSTLGTMFDGNLDFLRHNDDSGIAQAFLDQAARSSSTRASLTSSNTLEEDSETADNSDVDMGAYVHGMDESEPEAEMGPLSAAVLSPTSNASLDFQYESSPVKQLANSSGRVDHLAQSTGLVSSFRNNQQHARHLSSLAANPAKRAQTSEANALQKGRRTAANTPMTPARKNRSSQDLSRTGAGVSKASASPLVQKRCRSRGNSLSQTLALDRFAGSRNN